jgi:hypothetical protein
LNLHGIGLRPQPPLGGDDLGAALSVWRLVALLDPLLPLNGPEVEVRQPTESFTTNDGAFC